LANFAGEEFPRSNVFSARQHEIRHAGQTTRELDRYYAATQTIKLQSAALIGSGLAMRISVKFEAALRHRQPYRLRQPRAQHAADVDGVQTQTHGASFSSSTRDKFSKFRVRLCLCLKTGRYNRCAMLAHAKVIS